MGELKVTSITLQMADRSVKRPLGILEDVPVKVGKYFIPVDFVVLDIAEDTHIPIILGRPFLHTAGAIIDVKNGKLTLDIGEDKVTFNLSKTMRSPMIEETVCSIDIGDECIVDTWGSSLSRDSSDALICLDPCAGESLFHDTGLHLERLDKEAEECHVAVFKEPPPISKNVYRIVGGVAKYADAAKVTMEDPPIGGFVERSVASAIPDVLLEEGYEESSNSKLAGLPSVLWPNHPPLDNRAIWRPRVVNGDDIPFI